MGKYDEWKDEYYNSEKVNLKEHLSTSDFLILEKLKIEVFNKVYTENEFELLYSKVISNYDEENGGLKESIKKLGVREEELNNLINKLDNINEIYDF